ncbi:MAG: OmpA family protein [Bacteroidia bacterium]|nr:OmpA family protein [Bacteroidia bacterium]
MHPIARIIFVVIPLFFSTCAFGQSFEYPWAISGGAGLVNYRPHPGNPALHENLFDVGYQIGFQKYLNGAFQFGTQIMVAPQVRFPEGIISRRNSLLIDMQYRLSFKLNNGVILKESGLLGPYVTVGMGGSYANGHPDAYIPLGGGVRLRINPRMAVRVETIRKISVNKDYQSVDHALAFIYNLDTKKTKVELDPQEIKDIETVASLIPPDTDNDGLIDSKDACPEVAGPLGMNGCPTSDFSKLDTDIVVIDEKKEVEDNEVKLASNDNSIKNKPEKFPATTKNIPSKTETKEEILPKEKPETEILVLKEQDSSPCGEVVVANDGSSVLFAFGSDQISSRAYKELDKIAEKMKSCSNTKLVLSGHTDDKGSEKDNLVLSIKRAFNVKYYLVNKHNISQYRITSDGLGENKPLAENSTSGGREKNRRVDLKFVF